MKMSKAEIEARDKRRAAVHEGGHLTVAMATVGDGRAHINPTGTADPTYEKAWVGQFSGVMNEVIAVAGAVAEMMESEPDIDAYTITDALAFDDDTASPTDRERFPSDANLMKTIRKAMKLLAKHRAFFEWAVADLITNEVITDGVAREAWDRLEG